MFNKRYKEDDSNWVDKYLIQIHGFIAMWKAKKYDREELKYKHQAMQCAFE